MTKKMMVLINEENLNRHGCYDVIVNMMNMINILDHFLINNIIWLVILTD